ncbi:MAG: hypothetical protein GXO23_02575 [Crenarchaeota archaeon]|nr:hypothetical protein [Thermoproteota archaeon]
MRSDSRSKLLERIFNFLCREDIREEFLRTTLINIFLKNFSEKDRIENIQNFLEKILNNHREKLVEDCEVAEIDSLCINSNAVKSKPLGRFISDSSVERFVFIMTPGLLREFLLFLSILRKYKLEHRIQIDVITTYPDPEFVDFLKNNLINTLSKYFKIYFKNMEEDTLDQDIPYSSYMSSEEKRGVLSLRSIAKEYYEQKLKFITLLPAVPLYILINILNILCESRDLSYLGYIRFSRKGLILFVCTITAICCH